MNKLDPSNRNPLVEPKLAQPILHSFQLILGITIGQCNIHWEIHQSWSYYQLLLVRLVFCGHLMLASIYYS